MWAVTDTREKANSGSLESLSTVRRWEVFYFRTVAFSDMDFSFLA